MNDDYILQVTCQCGHRVGSIRPMPIISPTECPNIDILLQPILNQFEPIFNHWILSYFSLYFNNITVHNSLTKETIFFFILLLCYSIFFSVRFAWCVSEFIAIRHFVPSLTNSHSVQSYMTYLLLSVMEIFMWIQLKLFAIRTSLIL